MSADILSAKADVLVIGAGIYGCAAAYFLAKFGIETLVIDAEDIGAGASGANAGNLHLQLSPSTYPNKDREWVQQYAGVLPFFLEFIALWKKLGKELPHDLEMRFPGGLMIAENDAQIGLLREKVLLEKAHGLGTQLLGRSELRDLAPYLCEHAIGASHCPGEGMANPLAAVIALAEAARAMGARFQQQAEVEGIESERGSWRVQTSRGSICCRRVIIAAGYRSNELAKTLGFQLPLSNRAIQIVTTEACAPFIEHLIYHSEWRLTLKQSANGNVLIGGGWPASIDRIFGRPAPVRDSIHGSLWVARHVVPGIADLQLIRSWAGRNVYTPDGLPLIGAVPGHDGLFLAVCNSYGFTIAPLCGLHLAEQIAGRTPSFDPGRFAPGREALSRELVRGS